MLFDVAVAIPELCTSCECKGHFEILAGDKSIAVVTKDGKKNCKQWFKLFSEYILPLFCF